MEGAPADVQRLAVLPERFPGILNQLCLHGLWVQPGEVAALEAEGLDATWPAGELAHFDDEHIGVAQAALRLAHAHVPLDAGRVEVPEEAALGPRQQRVGLQQRHHGALEGKPPGEASPHPLVGVPAQGGLGRFALVEFAQAPLVIGDVFTPPRVAQGLARWSVHGGALFLQHAQVPGQARAHGLDFRQRQLGLHHLPREARPLVHQRGQAASALRDTGPARGGACRRALGLGERPGHEGPGLGHVASGLAQGQRRVHTSHGDEASRLPAGSDVPRQLPQTLRAFGRSGGGSSTAARPARSFSHRVVAPA